MSGSTMALMVALGVGGGALVWVRQWNARAREKRDHMRIVNRQCEMCGRFVQSERSRKKGELESVIGYNRIPTDSGTDRLVPRTANICDNCARKASATRER